MVRKLFGGTIEIALPMEETFLDSSRIRPIPDNQEVFTHMDKPIAVIVEVVEFATAPDPPRISMYHFDELARENEAEVVAGSVRGPILLTVAKSYSVGMQRTKRHEGTADSVLFLLYLGVLRVPEHEADILVSLNVKLEKPFPTVDGPESDYVYQKEFEAMLNSLNICDPSLFATPGK